MLEQMPKQALPCRNFSLRWFWHPCCVGISQRYL